MKILNKKSGRNYKHRWRPSKMTIHQLMSMLLLHISIKLLRHRPPTTNHTHSITAWPAKITPTMLTKEPIASSKIMDERSEMTPPFSKAEPREIFKLVTFIDYMHKRIDFNQPISPCYTLITQKSKIQ